MLHSFRGPPALMLHTLYGPHGGLLVSIMGPPADRPGPPKLADPKLELDYPIAYSAYDETLFPASPHSSPTILLTVLHTRTHTHRNAPEMIGQSLVMQRGSSRVVASSGRRRRSPSPEADTSSPSSLPSSPVNESIINRIHFHKSRLPSAERLKSPVERETSCGDVLRQVSRKTSAC